MDETMSSMYASMRERQLQLARQEADALLQKAKLLQHRLREGDPVPISIPQGVIRSAQELIEYISKMEGMDALFHWSDEEIAYREAAREAATDDMRH